MKLDKFARNLAITVALLVLIVFLITVDTHDAIDQPQAIKIAEQKLVEFTKQRGLVDSEFGQAEIRKEGSGWAIYYEGVGKNDLLVAISVGKTGGSALHSTTK